MTDPLAVAVSRADAAAVLRALVENSSAVLRRGDPHQLVAAARVLAAEDGLLPVAAAWRIGFAMHLTGRLDEALAYYGRADPDDPAVPADRAQLLAAHASTLWARGDAGSRALADRALAEAEACRDDSALASAWVAQALVHALEGDRNTNRVAYERALAAAVRAGDVLTQIRVLTNMGSLENEEGRYAAALGHLDRALTLWDPDVVGPVRALTCFNRAESYLGLGRVDEAVSELEQARTIARDAGSPLLALASLGLGEANRVRGNASQASAAYREAIALAESSEAAQVLVPALAGLARSVLGEDLDQALGLAKRALDQPAALGQVGSMLASGWLRLVADEPEPALELGRAAAQEAGRRHDSRGLAEALELQALARPSEQSLDLLQEAAGLWADMDNLIGARVNDLLVARLRGDQLAEQRARRSLRALGVRDDATRIAGALQVIGGLEAGVVSIRSLGPFAVFRGAEPIPVSAWQSRKPRDLLKILVGRRGRPVSREALCEMLWPDQADTGPRLSVVLSTVRSVLDPDKRQPSDHYVVADRQSVRLNPETVVVDAVTFTEAATEALRAMRAGDPNTVEALELAVAAYTGDFLEDDPYHDWAGEIRDELLSLSMEVRRALVRCLVATEPERAVPWLLGLVSDDPYDEPTHQQLIRILQSCGRYGEARRAHRRYESSLRELGVAPRTFEELVRQP